MSLLRIENLKVIVQEDNLPNDILRGVNLEVPEFSITALVGGSGSGKSTTGLSILGLLPRALHIQSGVVEFNDKNLLTCSAKEMMGIRGREISMIFQEPLNAFNPVISIGVQIDEMLSMTTKLNKSQREDKAMNLLKTVGIKDPMRSLYSYPHQLSGGMRQRAMIAMAIAGNPKLIIADEPTSNLDVTLQAKIMELFIKLKEELNLSILLITHDLGMVSHISDRIAVMSEGEVIEQGQAQEVVENPQRQYTRDLMEAFTI